MPADRTHARFLPQVGHWTPGIVIHEDGAMSAAFHLAGMAAELAGARSIISDNLRANQMARNASDPRVEVWDHFVRQDRQDTAVLPVIPNWFAARFDAAYSKAQGAGSLYRNDLFLTVVMRPADTLRSGMGALLGRSRGSASCDPQAVQDFETLLGKMEAGLSRYGSRRLALREAGGVMFSEIAEAMHLVMTGRFRPLGLTMGRLGHLILPERAIFGQREMQIVGEGDPLRRHPAYKAALDRGAVELWMPKMEPKSLAFEIERRRAHFFQVRDGVTPPGSKPADITPFERMIVGEWLRTMDDCFSPVATWIPRAAS